MWTVKSKIHLRIASIFCTCNDVGCYNTATVLNLTLNNAFNQSLVNAVFGDTFYGKLMCHWGIGHISISESLHEQWKIEINKVKG